ncbi:hypothetical protein Syun_018527 [Stephania yunnanensis]|uniref:RanBP2-type domain-containing protein n=1 Tax=Stephania yunnanensis TaxID=152371 RepID=A0AAP0NX43_9MAGN
MGSVPPSGSFSYSPYYLGGGGVPPPPVPPIIPSSYVPPFSVPVMPYEYGAPTSASGHYGHLSPYPGSFGGMGYGARAAVAGYGFGVQVSPFPTPGHWSGDIANNNASRKRRGGTNGMSQGDWICPKCDNINFAFRTSCNMKKCGTPRPSTGPQSCSGAPEGSWTCSKCENFNYPFRTVCNRKGCGSEKPSSGK